MTDAAQEWWDASLDYDSSDPLHPDYIFGGGSSMALDLEYDDRGMVTHWDSWSMWLHADYDRDLLGRTLQARYSDGSDQVALTLGVTYSAAGFVTSLTGQEGTHHFQYDEAGRILQADHPSPDNPPEAFSYDQAGNRMVAGQESDYRFDAARRLLQDPNFVFEYDEAGNRILRRSRSTGEETRYAYDGGGRLVRVELPSGRIVEYGYDAFNRRVEKKIDGTVARRYIWHESFVLAELDGTGRVLAFYTPTWYPDAHVGVRAWNGTDEYIDYYFARGPDGTVQAVFDDSGTLVESYRYRVFGLPVGLPAAPITHRLFAGMDYDQDTGLYYLRSRWYDPQVGLFIQRDPLPMGQAKDPYGYASHRPWTAKDPSGLDSSVPLGPSNSLGEASWESVGKPALESAAVQALEQIPKVGGKIAGPAGMILQAKDLIKIGLSDDPLKAGRDWYKSQWWNPAARYVDSFTSIGGVGSPKTANDPRTPDKGPGCSLFPNNPSLQPGAGPHR